MTQREVVAALARLGRTVRVNSRTGQIAILHRVRGRDAPIFVTVTSDALKLGFRPDDPGTELCGAVSDAELAAALESLSSPDAG